MKTSTPLGGPRGRRQCGAVAIMFGLSLAVLIGFAGLAIDLGRFFVIKTELQNAMDACALAASSQLRPGQNNPNALTRAVAYGSVFTNKANFQSVVVAVQPDQITFSGTLGGSYQNIA
ncbi:MAG: pilus assembly protein TadG-related protein, partial [Lysobacterales bacterium]